LASKRTNSSVVATSLRCVSTTPFSACPSPTSRVWRPRRPGPSREASLRPTRAARGRATGTRNCQIFPAFSAVASAMFGLVSRTRVAISAGVLCRVGAQGGGDAAGREDDEEHDREDLGRTSSTTSPVWRPRRQLRPPVREETRWWIELGDLFYCLFLKLNRTLISIVCFWETFFTATPK
jgi:hypothetical protein